MKASRFHSHALALVVAATSFSGLSLENRPTPPATPDPSAIQSQTPADAAPDTAVGPVPSSGESVVSSIDTNQPLSAAEPGTNAPPARAIAPAQIELPAALTELVRLAESGVSEDVLLAFIQKSPPAEPVTADQILYLRDLGISSQVLTALIQAHPANFAVQNEPVPAPTVPQYPPAYETTNAVEAPLTPPAEQTDYYSALSPYGSWLDLPGYGWCWQPTVVSVCRTWRPYCDAGYWAWSDCGWYWNSYYSWGSVPFHYGRWCEYPRYGWVWCPDQVWGPAWVCWRQSGSYCGWAPLPPGSCLTRNGWTHHGIAVGTSFGFGLPSSSFTFVSVNHFTDRHSSRHQLNGREAQTAFNQSHVNNDVVIRGADQRIVNRGIDPNRVAAVTRQPLRPVAVAELEKSRRPASPPTGMFVRTGASSSSNGRVQTAMRTPSTDAASALVNPGQRTSSAGLRIGQTAQNTQGNAGNAARAVLPRTALPRASTTTLNPGTPTWRSSQQLMQPGSSTGPNRAGPAYGNVPLMRSTVTRSQAGSPSQMNAQRGGATFSGGRSQAQSSGGRSSSSSAPARSDGGSSARSSGSSSSGGSSTGGTQSMGAQRR